MTPALLDQPGADAAGLRPGDVRDAPGRTRCSMLSAPTLVSWIQLALATPVVLWGGRPFFERGWASIVNRRLNMFTLIAIGTGTAYGYSVVATLLPGIFPAVVPRSRRRRWRSTSKPPP